MAGKLPRGLRVHPKGRGIQIRVSGRGARYEKTLDLDPTKPADVAAAVRHRDEIIARLRVGLAIVENEPSRQRTFQEAAQDYMNALEADYSTASDYLHSLNHWVPHLGNKLVSEVTAGDVKTALASMNVSGKTKRNRLVPLRGVFTHAEVQPNPANIKIKKQQKARIDRYRPEERDRLLSCLEGQAKVYFALLFGCGLRPGGEPLGLQWSDYDGETIYVHRTIVRRRIKATTKTHTARHVYVPTWVRPILANHPTRFAGTWVFVNSAGGHHLDPDRFNEAWAAAHRKARIPYRIPYVCRHTRAAELLSTGVDPADAAKQLGHSLEMFYRTYSEFIEEYAGARDMARFEGHGVRHET